MATTTKPKLSGTMLVHADDELHGPEVAPSISVTTTFRAPNPLDNPVPREKYDMWNPDRHVYSRFTQNVSSRVERVLSKINVSFTVWHAPYVAAY
ncbi:hypothetical protein NUW54_g4783 [Trametes sanguinea]|uniref:Uncharacterized protein n=1 Tax=Trametes sanguinea TaxID=158606 RepID=A0ACC1Q0F0_9APHY|nr:hypothetical protein NUW54_g4783 [Trametes sanguinea]